jgi:DNA-binding CsgD family transcriptional regulator
MTCMKLTRQQKLVLETMATGVTQARAGEILKISHRTVGFHLGNIYKELDCDSLLGALKIAMQTRQIEPPEWMYSALRSN